MAKSKYLNVCETCFKIFDDYDGAYVDRGGYCSMHCDSCIEKRGFTVKRRVKERKIKNK